MLLTISTTHVPATDLGYLLHKNPARAQSVELSFGRAHVFYPESASERCTAALVLDAAAIILSSSAAVHDRRAAITLVGTWPSYPVTISSLVNGLHMRSVRCAAVKPAAASSSVVMPLVT